MRATLAVLAGIAIAPALAQMGTGQPGAGRGYNPANETTIQGTIQEVRQTQRGRSPGTHIVVNTPQGPMEVALGPSWFINQQQLNLTQGSQVRVIGSPMTYNGQRIVVAREVETGGRTVQLRNAQGVPAWSGGRGMAGGALSAPRYDTSQEQQLQGTIRALPYYARGPVSGRHLILNTAQGEIEVALGPQAFLDQEQIDLAPGDQITVTAAPAMVDGRRIFMAREIEKGGHVFALRNPQGVPLWAGAGGMRMGGMRTGIYNPQTETTVSGTVQSVNQCACGPWTGSYAVVNTDRGPVDVFLGPSDFLQGRQMRINAGDQIQVTGSRIDIDGTDLLLARSISKGGQTVALRNAQGMPNWAGRMRRGAPVTDEMRP